MWEVREPAIILPIYNFRTQTVGNNESYDLLLFELMFARSQVIKSNDEMGPVLIGNATFKGGLQNRNLSPRRWQDLSPYLLTIKFFGILSY